MMHGQKNIKIYRDVTHMYDKKVRQSRYRPGVAQRVTES